jgi:hypothetical protein
MFTERGIPVAANQREKRNPDPADVDGKRPSNARFRSLTVQYVTVDVAD